MNLQKFTILDLSLLAEKQGEGNLTFEREGGGLEDVFDSNCQFP